MAISGIRITVGNRTLYMNCSFCNAIQIQLKNNFMNKKFMYMVIIEWRFFCINII